MTGFDFSSRYQPGADLDTIYICHKCHKYFGGGSNEQRQAIKFFGDDKESLKQFLESQENVEDKYYCKQCHQSMMQPSGFHKLPRNNKKVIDDLIENGKYVF